MDAYILTQNFVELPQLNTTNALGLSLAWASGGTEVLGVVSNHDDTFSYVNGFTRYRVDGTPVGDAPMAQTMATNAVFVSPGATRALLWAHGGAAQIVDTKTGSQTVIDLNGYTPVGWADEYHLLAVADDPTRTAPLRHSVLDMSGSLVATVAPPAGVSVFQSIIVGSSAGLPTSAAGLTF